MWTLLLAPNLMQKIATFDSVRFVLLSVAFSAVILLGSSALADAVFGSYFAAHSNDVTYTEISLLTPSSTVSGNFLLANLTFNGGSEVAVTDVPYGWTLVERTNNDVNVTMLSYYKIATSSGTDTNVWKVAKKTTGEGAISRYTDVDTVNPIAASSTNSGFGTLATTSPVMTTAANQIVVSLFGTTVGRNSHAPYFSAVAGTTERYNRNNDPFGPSTASIDHIQATSGSVGVATSTLSENKDRYWVSQQIALKNATPQLCASNSDTSINEYDTWGNSLSPIDMLATKITPSQDCTVSSISVLAARDISRTNDAYIMIWSDDGGISPLTSIATGSTMTITSTNPDTSPSWATSTFSGANQITLHGGTTYWIVDGASSTAASLWFYQKEGGSGTEMGWDGSTWTNTHLGNPSTQFIFNVTGIAQ
jgi:hypothetical protein